MFLVDPCCLEDYRQGRNGSAACRMATQFFKLGNVARLSEPMALSARRAERQLSIDNLGHSKVQK